MNFLTVNLFTFSVAVVGIYYGGFKTSLNKHTEYNFSNITFLLNTNKQFK